MKTKCLLILILFLYYLHIAAQASHGFSFSGRAGLGGSYIQTGNLSLENVSPRLSLSAGVLSDYCINNSLSVGSGFILVSKGSKIRKEDFNQTLQHTVFEDRYEMLYGEIPLTAKISWPYNKVRLHSYLGPSMNLLFSSRVNRVYETNNNPRSGHDGAPEQNISKADYSLTYGFGINSFFHETGNFFADIRFNHGITSFGMIDDQKVYNHYYSLTAGYTFK